MQTTLSFSLKQTHGADLTCAGTDRLECILPSANFTAAAVLVALNQWFPNCRSGSTNGLGPHLLEKIRHALSPEAAQ